MQFSRIEPFLDHPGSIHARTRRVVMCIPPDDLEWSSAGGKFSLGDTVRHLGAIGRRMYAEAVHDRPERRSGRGGGWARCWSTRRTIAASSSGCSAIDSSNE